MEDSERLKELYAGVAVHATANREHMAALELLAVIMVADRTLDEDEIVTLRELSADWRGDDFTFEEYLGPAIAKARAAQRDGTTAELVDDIDGRISSRVLRKALFSAARQMSGDGAASEVESELLADIAVRFG